MCDRNGFLVWKTVFAVLALFLLAGNAFAYVGPGAGLELVGYSMSLLVWVGVAFSAMFLYPFYSFLRWIRGDKRATVAVAASHATPAEAGGDVSHVHS
jgi:hypothetical protein